MKPGFGDAVAGGEEYPALSKNKGWLLYTADREKYSLALVLALGRPKETVVLVSVKEDGNTKYYRDKDGIHYVPKRGLDEILL